MRTNEQMMTSPLSEEAQWKRYDRHINAVAEIAVLLMIFCEVFIIAIMLS